MSAKQLMTRTEIVSMLRNNVFGLVDTGQSIKWVDFFIETGMLEVKKEEDKPIFEIIIKGQFGYHVKIWPNGRMEGLDGTIINRIPEYLKNNS